MDCVGSLIPHMDTGVPCSTMLVTWREMSKKASNTWRMERRIEEPILHQKNKFPISQISAVLTPDFMCGDHHYIWSETRTNRCSVCD